MYMLVFLDYFFLIFHSIFTLFNMTGWIWKKTRKYHLITTLLTTFSWFILGIRYGWGYCFCTDWHWKVREALGNPIKSDSYIKFLIEELTGFNPPGDLVDTVTIAVFFSCVAATIILNARDYSMWRSKKNSCCG